MSIAIFGQEFQGFGTSRPYFAQADIRGTLIEHVGDPRDREGVLAAALMRVAGVGNSRVYAAPKEPFEIAAATAIFCGALGDASSLRDVQSILAYPNARRLRNAIARDVSPDTADRPSSFAPRIRRRLGNILASMMRS